MNIDDRVKKLLDGIGEIGNTVTDGKLSNNEWDRICTLFMMLNRIASLCRKNGRKNQISNFNWKEWSSIWMLWDLFGNNAKI